MVNPAELPQFIKSVVRDGYGEMSNRTCKVVTHGRMGDDFA